MDETYARSLDAVISDNKSLFDMISTSYTNASGGNVNFATNNKHEY